MRTLLVYAVLVVTPTGVLWAARVGLARFTRPPRSRAPATVARPVERLAADLRRLSQDYRATERADVPGRASRLRALGLAYDDTLRDCCRALDLPLPSSPMDAVSRLQTEAALAQRGLAW